MLLLLLTMLLFISSSFLSCQSGPPSTNNNINNFLMQYEALFFWNRFYWSLFIHFFLSWFIFNFFFVCFVDVEWNPCRFMLVSWPNKYDSWLATESVSLSVCLLFKRMSSSRTQTSTHRYSTYTYTHTVWKRESIYFLILHSDHKLVHINITLEKFSKKNCIQKINKLKWIF